ncbi:hypothetical protein LZ30DRAFT_381579 [Colletotrichum cereale]|nr:hypothetical protein LZ30DRAFT_381579 [Colletotrichum cereale]
MIQKQDNDEAGKKDERRPFSRDHFPREKRGRENKGGENEKDKRTKSDHHFYQQVMASTPMPPQFPPDVFGGAFDFGDRPHYAIRPGNQPTLSIPGDNRPSAFNERQVAGLQHQPHPSALGPGLTHADYAHQHQFGPGSTSLADQQRPSPLLHPQGHQQQPNAWLLPRGYGVSVYHGGQQQQQHQQQHADATSSSFSFATAAGVNPSATIPAAGGLGDNSSESIGTGDHLYEFGYAAPPPGEPLFLGEKYADITPLSTAAAAAAAVAAHPQPLTTAFDFHPSPWRPRLQDSNPVNLTPKIAAVTTIELDHDVRKHGKASMETDSDVKDPSWDDEDNGVPEARCGAARTHRTHRRLPGFRMQESKGKRRAMGDRVVEGGDDDNDNGEDDNEQEPTSPGGRTSTSGRSIKSASAASSAGSSSKAAVPGPPRLRSASRTSKNQSQKSTETPEERRTRASHNLVEKQYRNRLNAQFEGLLHALPEQMRSPAGAGDGEESDPSQRTEQERRVSKAEVLEMARRHIKNLEEEREALNRERGELLRA